MSRKTFPIFALMLALAISLASRPAPAQNACVILSSTAQPFKEAKEGFRKGFGGPVEEIVMPPEPAKAGEIVASITAKSCKVVVPMGSAALKFLRLRVSDMPIVFAMTLSPAVIRSEGLNMTGVYLEPSPGMQLASIRKVLPAARRVGVLYSSPSEYLSVLERNAGGAGLEIVAVRAPKIGDAIREAESLVKRSDVLLMIPDVVTSTHEVFKSILLSSLSGNIPIFALAEKHVEAGALAALVTDYESNGAQAAVMARRVSAGASASSIKTDYSNKAGLVLNLKVAARLGIAVPEAAVNEAVDIYR